MANDRLEEITDLLTKAGAAHGVYENDKLNGVYDQEWARWYAGYVVEQGISALLGHAVTVDQVASFFSDTFADFQRANTGELWTTYTVRRIQDVM